MRTRLMVTWLALHMALLSGCGPKLSRDELGEVIFTLPQVSPSKPYSPAAPTTPSEPPADQGAP